MAENLKTLATYATPIEAEMVRNRLLAAGVQAFLADDQTVGWLWHLGTAMQGVKVQVAEADLPRAREILEALPPPQLEDRPPQAWSCPKCGAEVDAELEVCWACGTTADGEEDADFQDAEAAVTPKPTKRTGPKGPPGALLAVLIAFCIPMYIFNTLVGIDFFIGAARYATSGGLLLLVLAGDFLLVVGLFQWFYYQPPSSPEIEPSAERLETASGATVAEEAQREPAAVGHRPKVGPGALARRACLAALLGMVLCPLLLNFYSIWLILRYELYRPAVCRKWAFFVYTAIVIDAVVCLMSLMLFLLAGGLAGR
jgi:hypothetical protein